MKHIRKIVVASDSFKGSLSSLEVAEAAEIGIRAVCPQCEVLKIPVADGGEGTVKALTALTNGRYERCWVHDPLMRPIEAVYGISGNGRMAIIEMAAASGLPLLKAAERNPALTSTFGTGELILDALRKGCSELLIGIGGSATNDAGMGMLQALGFVFRDSDGCPVGQGGDQLARIVSVDTHRVTSLLTNVNILVACDVNNPFCGELGAAAVFAPQKGADAPMIVLLERGMCHFAQIIRTHTQVDVENLPGAGAAGGLGGALVAFLGAKLKPGIELVLDAIDFKNRIKGADLLITGEGRMDAQTCMGKAPAGILKVALGQQIPVVGIAGSVADTEKLCEAGFQAVFPISDVSISLQQAMEKTTAQKNISRTVEQLLRLISL